MQRVALNPHSVQIHYAHEQTVFSWDERTVVDWHFVVEAIPANTSLPGSDPDDDDDDDDEYLRIGHGVALTVPVHGERSAFDALDEHSESSLRIAEILLDRDSGELAQGSGTRSSTSGTGS
ncbi:hypothetical protein BJF78_34710 [Pseudonocardia sp. CNS-139]|nr:hypothetical protein BJF78_34710 [Pseudonocardia sp. CNS-139]